MSNNPKRQLFYCLVFTEFQKTVWVYGRSLNGRAPGTMVTNEAIFHTMKINTATVNNRKEKHFGLSYVSPPWSNHYPRNHMLFPPTACPRNPGRRLCHLNSCYHLVFHKKKKKMLTSNYCLLLLLIKEKNNWGVSVWFDSFNFLKYFNFFHQ